MAPEVLLGRGSFLHLFRDDLQKLNKMQTSVPISSEDCSLMASSGLERLNDEDRALPAGTARPVTFGRSVCASTNFSASQLHLQPRCVVSCVEFFLLARPSCAASFAIAVLAWKSAMNVIVFSSIVRSNVNDC